MRGRGWALAFGIWLWLAPDAVAQTVPAETPVTVSELPGPSGASTPRGILHVTGPIFLGVLAAMFLMVGALIGKNDKPGH
jgi:hypothetical protein